MLSSSASLRSRALTALQKNLSNTPTIKTLQLLSTRSTVCSSSKSFARRDFITRHQVPGLRTFSTSKSLNNTTMSSDLEIELTAPNGRKYLQPLGLFINNEFVKSSDNGKITSINPTNEQEIASVYAATVEDIDTAVSAARKAFKDPTWRDLSGTERGDLLTKLSQLVERDIKTLKTIETWDNGKPYSMSGDDLAETVNTFKYYGGYADKIHGNVIDVGPSKLAYTIQHPIGVAGQIIPWNFPILMAAWKLGPSLAAGCTVVIKAAEQTPLGILYLAKLIKEAGFPPGVVNVVNGHGRIAGKAIAEHVGIDKVAFTGSTVTGREIMKSAAVNLKTITLETGGKSPLLVFEDAELDQAVKWSHMGIMYNQGQVCTATSRILVQESIYEKFIEEFKKTTKEVSVVGDPFDETTFQGPLVTKQQYERVLAYVQAGKDDGATLISGGERHTEGPNEDKGFFIQPTIFKDVKPNMKIYQEEVFGPFVVIGSFKTEDEGVEMANQSEYGLGAAVFTRDIERAHRVARHVEAGMVWINSSNDSDYRVPFGGVKGSGIGRELGEEGIRAYSVAKAVHVNMGTRL